MKKIELYRPLRSNEKYGMIISIDTIGKQEIKSPLKIGVVVDDEKITLGDLILELANENEKLRLELAKEKANLENAIELLKQELKDKMEKQDQINKLLYNTIKEEGVI